MRILEIELHNYGSYYGTHRFRLSDRGLTAVLGDNRDEPRMNSNGSGKSTIFRALDWCFFGVIDTGDHVDSIINDECSDCYVKAWVDDDGEEVEIERSKARGKSQTLTYSLEDSALDIKETQRRLELFLGLDRDVFHATVLYGQEDIFHFADTTSDTARMEVVTKILQLSSVDEWLEVAKQRAKTVDTEISGIRLEMERLRAQIPILENNIPMYKAEASKWETERAESLRQAMVQLNEYEDRINNAKRMVAMEDRVRAVSSVVNPMGGTVYDWSDFDRRIADARESENQWRAKLAENVAAGKSLKSRMDGLGTGVCSECGQELPDKDHILRETNKLEKQRDQLLSEYYHITKMVDQCVAGRESIEADKKRVQDAHIEAEKDLARREAEAQAQIQQIQEAREYLQKAEPHVVHLRHMMAVTQAKVNPWFQKEHENQQNLSVQKHRLGELQEALNERMDTARYYEFWVKGLGSKGLKSYVLDHRLQEMTDSANEWVHLLTGGTFWIRFETQTLGRSTKKLANKINIRVFKYSPSGKIRERNYRSYSGGQKKRISWAIDFGLSRIIARRATKRYDLMILDEVFKHVDSAGGEAVVEMLRHLRREKSSIFVVEHDASFQSHFENVVLTLFQNERSQIVEESDVQQVEKKEAAPRKTRRNRKTRKAQSKGKAGGDCVQARSSVRGRRRAGSSST